MNKPEPRVDSVGRKASTLSNVTNSSIAAKVVSKPGAPKPTPQRQPRSTPRYGSTILFSQSRETQPSVLAPKPTVQLPQPEESYSAESKRLGLTVSKKSYTELKKREEELERENSQLKLANTRLTQKEKKFKQLLEEKDREIQQLKEKVQEVEQQREGMLCLNHANLKLQKPNINNLMRGTTIRPTTYINAKPNSKSSMSIPVCFTWRPVTFSISGQITWPWTNQCRTRRIFEEFRFSPRISCCRQEKSWWGYHNSFFRFDFSGPSWTYTKRRTWWRSQNPPLNIILCTLESFITYSTCYLFSKFTASFSSDYLALLVCLWSSLSFCFPNVPFFLYPVVA